MIVELAALMPHLFPIVGAAFSTVFMTIVLLILVKALLKTDVSDLFTSQDERGGISLTKFWQNIAYAAATVSFISVNISGKLNGGSLEIIWVIFLGSVASNAVMSKWISMKYGREEPQQTQRMAQYSGYQPRQTPMQPPSGPMQGPYRQRGIDDPDA